VMSMFHNIRVHSLSFRLRVFDSVIYSVDVLLGGSIQSSRCIHYSVDQCHSHVHIHIARVTVFRKRFQSHSGSVHCFAAAIY